MAFVVFVRTDDSFVPDCVLIANSRYNTSVCAHLVLSALNGTVSEIPRSSNNLNTSNYHILPSFGNRIIPFMAVFM